MSWDELVRKVFLLDLFRGLAVTFRNQDPKKIVTQQYPAERPNIAPQFRGAPQLKKNPETGEVLCNACSLCALSCPEKLITVTSERDEVTKKKVLVEFKFDTSRCMFCGICEEACQSGALDLSTEFEMASYSRDGQVWDRKKLEDGHHPDRYKC
jgi:NADH-quinone oxidoreductase subunit I